MYDFETLNKPDPLTCLPMQIAAKVLHPRTLEPVSNGTFQSFIRPEVEVEQESLEWHAKARNLTIENTKALWENAPSEKQVWTDFAEFTKRFHTNTKKQSWFSAPIRAGANIIDYDNIIWDRMCKKHGFIDTKRGEQNLAFPRDNLDIQAMLWYWFESYDDGPEKLKMDVLRDYFGIKATTAHDAISDIDDTISILVPFMKLFRRTASSLNFRGALTKKAI